MQGGVIAPFQDFWRDIGVRKVRHRVPAWFEEQQNVLTFGDRSSAKAHAHAAPQWLGIQKPLW